MTEHLPQPQRTRTVITEDVLLVLFQPDSGTIAGENVLFYVLAGGVLADLAQRGHAVVEESGTGGILVRAAGDAPEDELLRAPWDYISQKPRDVQTVLAAIGPPLRGSVLDALVQRGEIRRQKRRVLGLFPSTALVDAGTGRRAALVATMRAVLVDGETPSEHVASLIALVSASGSLPVLDREIPWTSRTATRAQSFERGDWAAGAAAAAVTRTMLSLITNAVIAGAATANR